MDNTKLVRFLLTFFLGWIGSLIINHTSLKPEGFTSKTGWYLIVGYITGGIYILVASICNLFFDPAKEKNIGYAESHDQALVGDKTIMFRLCDADMYTGMDKASNSPVVERGMALHKMIRLVTASLAGEGYLNFMGNEFGHPEWIDFPREGNGWSYHNCRRQWNLVDNGFLRYGELSAFDGEMIKLLRKERLLTKKTESRWIGQNEKTLVYSKGDFLFAFNFSPCDSYEGYFLPCPEGKYQVALSTDEKRFGGHGRVDKNYIYQTEQDGMKGTGFPCYLPCRSAIVFKKI